MHSRLTTLFPSLVPLLLLLSLFILIPSCCHAEEPPTHSLTTSSPQALLFDPPSGWHHAEKPGDSPYVKLFIVGTGKKNYPPSINLCIEPYSGSLTDYMKRVQKINQEEGGTWKDLGSLQTPAGKGNLSQLDVLTQFGTVRMLHFILVDNGHAYILTAAALREEFPLNYKDFFTAIRSLRFGSVPPSVTSP